MESKSIIFANFFPKNCMKMKEFGSRGERASLVLPLDLPVNSETLSDTTTHQCLLVDSFRGGGDTLTLHSVIKLVWTFYTHTWWRLKNLVLSSFTPLMSYVCTLCALCTLPCPSLVSFMLDVVGTPQLFIGDSYSYLSGWFQAMHECFRFLMIFWHFLRCRKVRHKYHHT